MFNSYKKFIVPDLVLTAPAKKALPYTIIPIGNKEELLAWRKDQALLVEARESYLKPIRAATRARAISMIENQNADVKPDEISLMELEHVKAREGKVSYKASSVPVTELSIPTPKVTLMGVFKRSIARLWKSAGFDI